MSFVTIKFANNQNLLFNPNCKTLVLLDDIRKRCQCNQDAILDVSNTKGEIKHLQWHRNDYASSLLKGRELLILLEIKSNKETKEQKYIPLLRNMKKLYPEALDRISKTTSCNSQDKTSMDDVLKHSTKAHRPRQPVQSVTSRISITDSNNNQLVSKANRNINVDSKRKNRLDKSPIRF